MTAVGAVVVGALGVPATAATTAPTGPSADRFGPRAEAQIAALQSIKASLTPAERKLDSRLVVATRQRANAATTQSLTKLQTGVPTMGTVAVDIATITASAGLLSRLRAVGATVQYASARELTVRATLPVGSVTTVAGWSDVRSVSPAGRYVTAHETPAGPTPTKAQRAATVDARLRSVVVRALQPAVGSVTSEGDKAHAADKARASTKVQGVGVKVCALSDGIDSLAASQATGDLPAVDVLAGQEGAGDEGTAMLEIIHDLAPNAALGFATANTSAASFADNIRALRSQEHCDILVDDVLYYAESPFQDGPIAQAVSADIADGARYFSSAGNEGNVIDGTAGNFEGTFVDSGRGVGKFAGTAEDFDPGPGVQIFEPLSDYGNYGVPVTLWWADPLGHATDDYDLYLLDGEGNVVSFSQDVQDGTQDPFEILRTGFGGTGLRVAVVKYAGVARYFQLTSFDERFEKSADGLLPFVTPGVTRGHSAVPGAFSVAAAPAATPLPFDLEPGDPPNPSGPYPKAFTAAQKPERFTSDGPRRVFFDADGTPDEQVRQKPDITAADGVSTSVDGFSPFFGTSAAAPHAAAIAALVLSGNPGATSQDLRDAFDATALDLSPAGVDNRTGHGVIRADKVLAYTGATPQPLVQPGPLSVLTTTDGDTYLEPGETGTVSVPAVNVGDGTATGVSAVITTADPQVTVTPRALSYGSLAAGATKSRSVAATLAAGYPLGKPLALTVRITFAGVLSPTVRTVSLPTGQPATTATTFAYAGPPVPIPDDDVVGASVGITVTGGYAAALTFSVDGTTCTADAGSTTVGLDHTFVGDLAATLVAPSGATARLFTRDGGSGHNLCQVVFDDAAAAPFSSVDSTQAPFTGTWRPDDPLSGLLLAPVAGTWTFHVEDEATSDTGSIRAVSLHITGFVPAT